MFTYYLLGKGGYVFDSVGLSVCLSVTNIIKKIYKLITMKFHGGVLTGNSNTSA